MSLGIYGLFALGSSPVAQVQAEAEGESDDAALVYVDGAYALYGAYGLETARSGLEAEGYELQAEAEDGADDFVVFADGASNEVVGVTDDAFVYAFGADQARSLAAVSAIVETNVGSQSPPTNRTRHSRPCSVQGRTPESHRVSRAAANRSPTSNRATRSRRTTSLSTSRPSRGRRESSRNCSSWNPSPMLA
ncbi:hypothetical protein ACFQMM_20290 [Saliphagus sp. GCM10025308]